MKQKQSTAHLGFIFSRKKNKERTQLKSKLWHILESNKCYGENVDQDKGD